MQDCIILVWYCILLLNALILLLFGHSYFFASLLVWLLYSIDLLHSLMSKKEENDRLPFYSYSISCIMIIAVLFFDSKKKKKRKTKKSINKRGETTNKTRVKERKQFKESLFFISNSLHDLLFLLKEELEQQKEQNTLLISRRSIIILLTLQDSNSSLFVFERWSYFFVKTEGYLLFLVIFVCFCEKRNLLSGFVTKKEQRCQNTSNCFKLSMMCFLMKMTMICLSRKKSQFWCYCSFKIFFILIQIMISCSSFRVTSKSVHQSDQLCFRLFFEFWFWFFRCWLEHDADKNTWKPSFSQKKIKLTWSSFLPLFVFLFCFCRYFSSNSCSVDSKEKMMMIKEVGWEAICEEKEEEGNVMENCFYRNRNRNLKILTQLLSYEYFVVFWEGFSWRKTQRIQERLDTHSSSSTRTQVLFVFVCNSIKDLLLTQKSIKKRHYKQTLMTLLLQINTFTRKRSNWLENTTWLLLEHFYKLTSIFDVWTIKRRKIAWTKICLEMMMVMFMLWSWR